MSKYIYGFSVYYIQEYIFSTNTLKEIIGASEIVEELTQTKAKGLYFEKYG